jgi:hypothetical protein
MIFILLIISIAIVSNVYAFEVEEVCVITPEVSASFFCSDGTGGFYIYSESTSEIFHLKDNRVQLRRSLDNSQPVSDIGRSGVELILARPYANDLLFLDRHLGKRGQIPLEIDGHKITPHQIYPTKSRRIIIFDNNIRRVYIYDNGNLTEVNGDFGDRTGASLSGEAVIIFDDNEYKLLFETGASDSSQQLEEIEFDHVIHSLNSIYFVNDSMIIKSSASAQDTTYTKGHIKDISTDFMNIYMMTNTAIYRLNE